MKKIDEAQQSWEKKAVEWNAWIGLDGDCNRRFSSDPVLWRMLGEVAGRSILDAGCGNGYLSIKLARKGARVIGIDWAAGNIELAQQNAASGMTDVDFRVDSCMELSTINTESIDCIVNNYVLMDLPDAEAAVRSFYRVLKPGGQTAIVICHPCFSVPGGPQKQPDGTVQYHWLRSYFEQHHWRENWGPFSTDFIFYQRPLSYYWRIFKETGFAVVDFDEPTLPEDRPADFDAAHEHFFRMTPDSAAFLLQK